MTPETILTIWNSGVNRWHANRSRALRNSGDCTDAHAARCCRLLLCLKPDASAELLAACLHHDVAEVVTGDVPWKAKQNASLADALHWMEAGAEQRLGLTQPRHRADADWIKLVDRLDAFLFVAFTDPAELSDPDWREAYGDIKARAWSLGVGAEVEGIMGAMA